MVRERSQIATGWCLLLLYLAAVSSVGLNVAALLSSLDGSHEVQVRPAAHGTQLVLHHESANRSHHHGLATELVTLFAAPRSASDPDHLLSFAAGASHVTQAKVQLSGAPAAVDVLSTALLHTADDLRNEHALERRHAIFVTAEGRPPGIRSTVLLI